MTIPTFVLASASPARRKLLQMAGIEPVIHASDFDESLVELHDPFTLVQELALCKAKAISSQWQDGLILGCDSVLAINGEIYGKPDSPQAACDRWLQMSGKCGSLYTGHALFLPSQHKVLVRCGITQVYFAQLNLNTIEAYVNTGEPLKCAGAFALEGKGGLFVDRIEGCHTNVIGLSLPLLREMLSELGYTVTDFWKS